jgi:3-oxoacyl-[acyl-carrier-protein] synthase-3
MRTRTHLPVEIAGIGSYLPERVLTNQDLEQIVDTTDDWIVQRTGIRERRIAAEHEATSDMAVAAARQALQSAGIQGADLDAVVVATCTPDYPVPATGCLVQSAVGATNALAFDLEAACSGFVYGYACAAGLIVSGVIRNALVVGADTLSRVADYTDRGSCILFGDGAGAVVLRPSQVSGEIIYTELGADGSHPEVLAIPAGGSRTPASHATVDGRGHFIRLQGHEVFKLAVSKLTELLQGLPERAGVALDKIKMIIPHQSNIRIIISALERAGLDPCKAHVNIDRVGNTSAASIPLAMAEALSRGELERGDLVLFLAFGGGLTWASMLIRY